MELSLGCMSLVQVSGTAALIHRQELGTDVLIVPAMEQFRFSVGTADSASLEVASGTGVLNNGPVSPCDELELTL